MKVFVIIFLLGLIVASVVANPNRPPPSRPPGFTGPTGPTGYVFFMIEKSTLFIYLFIIN